jgi:hypothetical protein
MISVTTPRLALDICGRLQFLTRALNPQCKRGRSQRLNAAMPIENPRRVLAMAITCDTGTSAAPARH